jgi:hypothetical protein
MVGVWIEPVMAQEMMTLFDTGQDPHGLQGVATLRAGRAGSAAADVVVSHRVSFQ